ncbi:MAG: phage major capsid protein [Gordonia polyisoprenivorans]|nr:phage major capsid protein [Gordonia polyisoprenivorans]
MTTMQSLREQSDELRAELQSVVSSKSLTTAEKHARLDAIERKNADLENAIRNHRRANAILSATDLGDPGVQGKSFPTAASRGGLLGSPMAINADGWKSMLAGAAAGQRAMIDLGSEAHRKAFADGITTKSTFDGSTVGSGLSSGAILPQVFPPIPLALESTRVADLFGHQGLAAPSWQYIRHDATTTPPAVTAEGATKPTIGFTFNVVTGKVSKIAGKYSYSWELARDYETFASQMIPAEMTRALIDAESHYLLSGVAEDDVEGTTPTADGLLGAAALTATVSSSDTAPGSPGLRAINKAITALRSGPAFAEADTIVLSPNTFGALRGAVDSMGRFILADANGAAEIPKIWNLRVCTTTMIADGTALIADSSQYAQVMVRDSITLMTTNQGAELASTNMYMSVIEERIGLAVPRPAAGLVLTGIVD